MRAVRVLLGSVLLLASCETQGPPAAVEHVPEPSIERSVARPDESTFARIAVFGVWHSSRPFQVCVVDQAGAVYCATPTRGLRLQHVPVLDGSRGISISWEDVCAASNDGDVTCVSRTRWDAPRPQVSGATEVAAANALSCALLAGGDLSCWGWTRAFAPGPTASSVGATHAAPRVVATGVRAFAVGGNHVILESSAGLSCLGPSYFGECGDARSPDSPAAAPVVPGRSDLALDFGTSCALGTEGVWCWGYSDPLDCPLESDGTFELEAAPCRQPEPRVLFPQTPADPYERIAGGRRLLCALTHSRDLQCGSLPSRTMHRVASDVVDFAVAGSAVCFISSDDSVRCESEDPQSPWILERPVADATIDDVHAPD